MRCFGDEWAQTFDERRDFFVNLVCVQRRLTVKYDDAIGFFEIALDAQFQNFWRKRVGNANAAPSGFVFICGTDAAQSRADFFVAEAFFGSVIERAVIRHN